jgi:outer membrane protein assembly factor BamA
VNWSRIEVEGTLGHPRLTGRVDIDPGGRLVLPGQTLRVDQGSLTWSGEVASEPRIELETTSSLVDPTIQQPWRSDWYDMGQLGPGQGGALDFASQQQAATTQFVAALGTGVLTHYQTRLAGSVTRSIGQTQISYAPLPLFGETDTEARFTFSQDMTRYMTFIASNDPKEAEAQTYIADVHTLPIAPSIQSQLFTNDEKNAGVTVQQRLRLGRGSSDEAGVTLRSITVAAPPEVPAKKIRRGIEYRKGDPFAEGSSLDVEVDAAEALRKQGFPAADVQAQVVPVPGDKVDVHVVVEPGARTKFEFLGEKLPRPAREAVIAAYRPALEGDEESFEAMFRETRRALHAQGFLDPEVKIEVLPSSDEVRGHSAERNVPSLRIVRIEGSGTRRIEPGPPVFEGVPGDVAVILSSLFEGQLGRVELAAATTEADVFVHQSLRALGYPTPSIVSRTLSDDGTRLVVVLEPGPREIIDDVEVVGVPADEAELLRDAARITPGEPARRDLIARGAAMIEARLREHGHAEANVQFALLPREAHPERQLLRYRAEPGPLYRIEDVRYEGMRASRPKWVAHIAGLEEGETLRQDDVSEARGRLYRTGVFRRIRVEMDPPIGGREPGEGPAHAGPIDTTATFRVEESPRYQLSYGGRWESSEGVGVVVDAIDRNSFGRGQISGVRALYARDTQSLRLYHAIPRVLGERNRLELFVEGSREIQDPNVLERALDSWAQLTLPLSARTQARTYIKFSEVKLSLIEPDPAAPPLDERTASPLFGWQLVWDSSTRSIGETRRGAFAGVDLSFASKNLGSDVTSVGLYDQFKFFVPLGGKTEKDPRYSWAQSWRTGFVAAAQGEDVPFADRLKLGGEYSVRGYPTDSLGPIDPATNQPLGGEFLFVVNQELHGRLFEDLTALVFLDAGNVWETPQAIEPELFESSGLGFRYVSPIGPLRLDFAFPLDRRPDDSEYTVYFGFGNVF